MRTPVPNHTMSIETLHPLQKLWRCKGSFLFQSLIKSFMGSNFKMANSSSKMKRYAFIFLSKVHSLGPNIYSLETWNALVQQQNEEMSKEIGLLILIFFTIRLLVVQKNWSGAPLYCTTPVKISSAAVRWCGALSLSPRWTLLTQPLIMSEHRTDDATTP